MEEIVKQQSFDHSQALDEYDTEGFIGLNHTFGHEAPWIIM